jgi:hypothetical protein
MRIAPVVLLLFAIAIAAPAASTMSGDWDAVITVKETNLRLALHVVESGKGLKATFDSIDQQAIGLLVDRIELKGRQLEFEMSLIMAKYTGVLQPDGKTIKGSWEQLGMTFPLNFNRAVRPASK